LISRFGGTDWFIDNTKSNDVANQYGINPKEVYEWDEDIQVAKNLAGIDYSYIGCGPLSLYCQFDYLVRGPGYFELDRYEPDDPADKRFLAKETFMNVSSISSESWLGQIFASSDGTFTFPSSLLSGARTILKNHSLMIPKTEVDEEG